MSANLLLVGGGHAHLTALLNLRNFVRRGHRVTVVGPSPYHYYSGMGPGLLSGIYQAREVRFNIRKMVEDRGGTFIEDRVKYIDGENSEVELSAGHRLYYDIVSFNTGSVVPVPWEGGGKDFFKVKPIENLLEARKKILGKGKSRVLSLLVVGGGPAGVEISGNLRGLVEREGIRAEISVAAGGGLLKGVTERVRRLVWNNLAGRRVVILEGAHVSRVADGRVFFQNGEEKHFDQVIAAAGVKPSPLFEKSGLPTGEDGGLLVNSFLQSVRYPRVFGGGDCVTLEEKPLARVGVYAVRQNPLLYKNLMAALESGPLRAFDPGGDYLRALNLGDRRGVAWKKGWGVCNGRLAFLLKDYIDRRFMRRFQVSGEVTETLVID